MYVVKRPFKSFGKVYTAGSLVEPAAVKHFKGKLAEGKIIEVTEQTYEVAKHYFKRKFGVDLPPISEPDTEATADDAEPIADSDAEAENNQAQQAVVVAKANVTVR